MRRHTAYAATAVATTTAWANGVTATKEAPPADDTTTTTTTATTSAGYAMTR